jgi:hypothetical protein
MPEFIKSLLQTNPARFVAYGTTAAIWLVVWGTEALGIPVAPDSELALAVGTIAAFVVTEVIRRLVYSPKTASEIVAKTTTTTAAANATAVLEGTPPAVQPAELP